MSIPLLTYEPVSQNQRVMGYEIPGDESPRIYSTSSQLSAEGMDTLITAAYRQIFHEQQMLQSNRQSYLESQLRSGQLTVREFVRGLATSDAFRRLNYDVNNNYRFVELCVQRILGRSVYSDRERLAWSIVLATKGLNGFIGDLVNSDEYIANFGDDTVPFQRRRVLQQRAQGELPFARVARYGTDYRDRLPLPYLGDLKRMGMFDPFETFNLQTFIQRANWPVVSAVLISMFVLIFLFLLLGSATNSISA